jgi:hypothetical protein
VRDDDGVLVVRFHTNSDPVMFLGCVVARPIPWTAVDVASDSASISFTKPARLLALSSFAHYGRASP